MSEILLVTGIHREELAFGDHVAKLVEQAGIDIMRVPEGISHAKTGTDNGFYFATQHREIYLQLKQQIKKKYDLVIDLHCGLGVNNYTADIFIHDDALIDCITRQVSTAERQRVRLIKIIAEVDGQSYTETDSGDYLGARTWIPESIWNGSHFAYVGLEIYLLDDCQGTPEEWSFTRELIEKIQHCHG